MKNENEKLDQLFENLENQWDIQELDSQHFDKFSMKLKSKKRKRNLEIIYSIAASVVVLVGIVMFYPKTNTRDEFKFASAETKQTDSIFTVLIENQLEQIKVKKTPENEKIINDALHEMRLLDSDYEKIKHELMVNGESKPIIYAMINNLRTRIAFLQNVLQQIEKTEKQKKLKDENTI